MLDNLQYVHSLVINISNRVQLPSVCANHCKLGLILLLVFFFFRTVQIISEQTNGLKVKHIILRPALQEGAV